MTSRMRHRKDCCCSPATLLKTGVRPTFRDGARIGSGRPLVRQRLVCGTAGLAGGDRDFLSQDHFFAALRDPLGFSLLSPTTRGVHCCLLAKRTISALGPFHLLWRSVLREYAGTGFLSAYVDHHTRRQSFRPRQAVLFSGTAFAVAHPVGRFLHIS